MLHNYYLYEENGRLSMLPWDYNLSFGAFGGGGARGGYQDAQGMPGNQIAVEEENTEATVQKDETQTTDNTEQQEAKWHDKQMGGGSNNTSSMINMAIDTPLSGTSEEDRPMWSALINNEEYKEQYHTLFDEFITNYLKSGIIAEEISRVQEMITPYVQKDPTKFYNYDEFQTAVDTLQDFIKLRTESIRKQLIGEIPSTTELQNRFTGELVDASNINISDMGSNGDGRKEGENNKGKMLN